MRDSWAKHADKGPTRGKRRLLIRLQVRGLPSYLTSFAGLSILTSATHLMPRCRPTTQPQGLKAQLLPKRSVESGGQPVALQNQRQFSDVIFESRTKDSLVEGTQCERGPSKDLLRWPSE